MTGKYRAGFGVHPEIRRQTLQEDILFFTITLKSAEPVFSSRSPVEMHL
jgi:hypothetical protein